MGLSKLASACQTCPFAETCEHKMMEAVGYLPLSQSASENASMLMAAPILRETMEIHIGGMQLTVYKDEIEKELYKQLYAGLGLQFGA